jgi:hypothetical protein
MASVNVTVSSMQTQSSSSQMNSVNSQASQLIITTTQESLTNLAFLQLSIQTSCAGKTVQGAPVPVEGYDPCYYNATNVTTVGMQAQAVVAFSGNISVEIMNYCQQYIDLAANSNANCTKCPTMDQCAAVS